MNIIKNTLAISLTALSMTFAAGAMAGPANDKQGREYKKQKANSHHVVTTTKRMVRPGNTVVIKKVVKSYRNQRFNKKITVIRTPAKMVFTSYPKKRSVQKYAKQTRFTKYNKARNNNQIRYVKQYNSRLGKKRLHKRLASVYRINRGDTLYRISLKTGISVNRLVRLNGLYGNKIHHLKAGQFLRLV